MRVLFAILISLFAVSPVASQELEQVLPEIQASIDNTKVVFGGCQFEVEVDVTITVGEKSYTEKQIQKFFSREGTHFRVDTTIVESTRKPGAVGSVSMFVVRPEGFARLKKTSADAKPVAIDWGTSLDMAFGQLKNYSVVYAPARTDLYMLDAWLIDPSLHMLKDVAVKGVSLTTSAAGDVQQFVGSFAALGDTPSKGKFSIDLHPDNFKVLAFDYVAGKSRRYGTTEYHNDFEFPRKIEISNDYGQESQKTVYRITDYSLEPAPKEYFEIDSLKQDPSISRTRWLWRLGSFVFGAFLVVIVVVLRRREKS